jgi:hypothetical protein
VFRQCFAHVLIVLPKEIHTTGNHFSSFEHTWFQKNYTCWNKHGEEGLNELEAGCLNEGEV